MSKRPVLPVIGGICSLIIAMGVSRFAYTPILPLMKEAIGFSEKTAGILASSNYLGYLVGALLASFINGGARKQKWLTWTLFINILSVAWMGFSTDYYAWLFLRFIAGITSGLIFVLTSSILLDILAAKGRLTWVGFFYSGVGIGIFMTGLVVPLLDSFFGWRGAWFSLAIISLFLGFVVLFTLKDDNHSMIETFNTSNIEAGKGKIANFLPWLIIAYGLEGLGYIVSATFIVDIVKGIPSLSQYAALSWVFVGIAAIPSTFLWVKLGERFGYINALNIALLIQAVGVVLPVIMFNASGALVGAFLFGATFMGITSLATSYARELQPRNSNLVIGIMTTIYGIGMVIGPIAAGVLVAKYGQYTIALGLASGVLLLAVIVLIVGRVFIKNINKRKEDVYAIRKY
ncbi:YbfB/YjiJ family MFS transporter [Calidifontibacillus oryziterrae]|uniref:YbfB/YjiJ family MFS transporter n=1 Tax=Calidifontibacillus oryziterrae TaxID=1191699 RepID=UPI000306A607|nr:YbfB/YjiJ family MFS transporter [Calidifontibacillus oryziterrae]